MVLHIPRLVTEFSAMGWEEFWEMPQNSAYFARYYKISSTSVDGRVP